MGIISGFDSSIPICSDRWGMVSDIKDHCWKYQCFEAIPFGWSSSMARSMDTGGGIYTPNHPAPFCIQPWWLRDPLFQEPPSCARLFFGPERNVACCRTGPGPPLRSLRSAWKKRDQRWGQFCGFASMTSWPQHRYENMAAAIKMIEVGLINLTVCDYDQPWQWQAGKPICRILTVGFLVCFSQGSLCSNSFPSARI